MVEILEERVNNLENFLDRELKLIEKLSAEIPNFSEVKEKEKQNEIQKEMKKKKNKKKNNEKEKDIEIEIEIEKEKNKEKEKEKGTSKKKSPNSTVLEEIKKLEESVFNIEDQYKNYLDPFNTKYSNFKNVLKKDEDSLFQDFSTKTKLIIQNKENLDEICNDLEEVKKLKEMIDKSSEEVVGDHFQKLHKLDLSYYNQSEEVNSQSLQIDTLVSSYNRIVGMISQKFIQMDSILTEYERK
ncbi:dynactin subunit 3 [Anaeramoeba flamelloides]|uniref:Dynactin subunit 3 n=1 Tax=Anaeramoeba flamelloides TaxID=1746091 RepID=A0ABQ8XC63_9EUKA|nr:dynactin subunit 3 [Anaeramoeba flamelloides]